jgi:integrase/recombinase XerC
MSEPAVRVEFRATSKRPGSVETPRGRHQEASPDVRATLQNPSQELLTAGEWAARQRVVLQMKDKTYRRYPIGQDVGQFLRKLRVDRCSDNTLESYETVLRKLTLDHLDFDSLDGFCGLDGYDLIVDFLDRHWGDSRGDTLGQRAAVVRSFFGWAVKSGRAPFNPADDIKVPRGSRRLRVAHELEEIRMIASLQTRIGDQAAVLVYGRNALRKMEGARLQARDIDLPQDLLYIRDAKGGKPAEVPITYPDVRQALSLWGLEPGREPTDHLVAPARGGDRELNDASVHRWWQRCCERAGVDPFPLHELRHSALHRIWRETGDLYAAKQLARHASVRTTEEYLHASADDLRARMLESDTGAAN